MVHVEEFEPVYLEVEQVHLTEYGKRHFDERQRLYWKFRDVIDDVIKLAFLEKKTWAWYFRKLAAEGVPQASGGMSANAEQGAVNTFDGHSQYTVPAVIALALGSAAPTVATTGVWGTTETTNYTGYARFSATPTTWTGAASGSGPATATNGAQIQWAACTASTATELGFLITDATTINTGNALWWAGITSVTISVTQTPPTLAASALTLSIN